MTEITLCGEGEYRVSAKLADGRTGTGRDPREAYENAKAEIIIVNDVGKVYDELLETPITWTDDDIRELVEDMEVETEEGKPCEVWLCVDDVDKVLASIDGLNASLAEVKRTILDVFKQAAEARKEEIEIEQRR